MLKRCNISTVNIKREHIVRSDKVKYLGGLLNSTLSFQQHVIAKCQAANINLQKIRHIRKFLTRDTCHQLVQSLVMSHLDYTNAMLSGIPKTLIKIMQCTQNQAARITIGKTKIRNDSATEIRRSLHWLPIKERIDFKIATHIYKCQNNQAPIYLQKLITERKIKQSWIAFLKTKLLLEVPSTNRYTYMALNFGILSPTVSKKAKQLTLS